MTTVDDLVAGYLSRLEVASATLPPDRRSELLSEISEHIADARAAGAAADEAAVRTLLDRLGDPAEIVAAAQEDVPPAWGGDAAPYGPSSGWTAPPVTAPRGTGLELAAVLLLTAGSFLPLVGWLVGVVLLWCSSLWRVREKLLGTLVVPLGPAGLLFFGALMPFGTAEVCTQGSSSTTLAPDGTSTGSFEISCTSSGPPSWVGTTLLVGLLIASIAVPVVLYRIAQRRAAAEPPQVVAASGPPGSAGRWGPLEVSGVLLLALGGLLIPFLAPLVGLVLVSLSDKWSTANKAIAAGLVLLPLLVPLSALLVARGSL